VTRAWRAEHRDELRSREASRTFPDSEMRLRRARAYVSAHVRRGKLKKGECEVCSARDTIASWDDPGKPLDARWFCREHHRERVELRRDIDEQAIEARAVIDEVRKRLGEVDSAAREAIAGEIRLCIGDRTGPAAALATAIILARKLGQNAAE